MSDDFIRIEAEVTSPRVNAQVGAIWQGEPGRGFVNIVQYWLATNLMPNEVDTGTPGWTDSPQWLDASKTKLYRYDRIYWTAEPMETIVEPVLVGVWNTNSMPAGGMDGQFLVKDTNADFVTRWETLKDAGSGLVLHNLISNGDFATSDLSSWTSNDIYNSAKKTENGYLVTTDFSAVNRSLRTLSLFPAGHRIDYRFKAKTPNFDKLTAFEVIQSDTRSNGNTKHTDDFVSVDWVQISAGQTIGGDSARLFRFYAVFSEIGEYPLMLDDVLAVDRTADFTAADMALPTDDEMDLLFDIVGDFWNGARIVTMREYYAWRLAVLQAQVVDAVNDLAGAGRTTETVKGNADEIADARAGSATLSDEIKKRALTLNGGALQTVTGKNQYYPLLSNVAGGLIGTHQTQIWNGSAWTSTNCYGYGRSALQNNTGAYANGFGDSALVNNTGASSNGFGYVALQNNTGTYANGVGFYALQNNTGANANGFGYVALQNNTGSYANGFGGYALQNNTGTNANGFGGYALVNNTGANANGFGYVALQNNTGASSNGFGISALAYNTGTNANGFGGSALQNNTGSYANGVGGSALRYNQSGSNTAVGHGANSTFLDKPAGAKTCASTDIDTTLERATITTHGFGATNAVVNLKYSATTGTAIGGLTVGEIAQVKIIDENTIEFINGSIKRNLTSQGTGNHTFTPQFSYSNTTCLGASTVPNKSNQVVLGDTLVDTVKMGGTARTIASASETGVKGEQCWDANYIYVCVATNTWKRTPLSSW